MKKILSIMLAGALTAGVAFADVSFSYTGTAIFGGTSKAISTVNRNDCFNLGFGDQANGAVIDWDIAPALTGTYSSTEADDTRTATGALSLDSYYAWMTFGLPVGNLQVTTGKWASRLVNRVNQDAGDLDGTYYEAFKPGVIVGLADDGKTATTGTYAADVDNLTGKAMGTVLAYTLDNVLPGKFMAKFGAVKASDVTYQEINTKYPNKTDPTVAQYDSSKNTYDGDLILGAGFVGEVAYAQDNVIKLNAAFRTLAKDQYAFGLFVSPLMVEKLSATAGFSMGMYSKDETTSGAKDGYKYNEWGVDLRARYAVTDKIAVTTMNNISGYKNSPDSGDSTDDKAMWNMVSVSAKAGDNISFLATVQNTIYSFNASKATDCVFAIDPACVIQASAKAKVTVGFDMRWADTTPFAGVGDVSLPVYFSFAL